MATITLTTDTLISTLMPSGGGSLASGDTIQLSGHSLIVDTDAVDYAVTIANGGADANLELRDLGRIKLNATLPATVHPWIDPAHPLPVAAEPGIDGDLYRTNLTANARAEIQLAGNFGLGGGAATLPTETRAGHVWATAMSWPTARTVVFDRDMGLVPGDTIVNVAYYTYYASTVESYNAETFTATLTADAQRRTVGDVFVSLAVSVVIVVLSPNDINYLTAPVFGGSIGLIGEGTTPRTWSATSSIVNVDRFVAMATFTNNFGYGRATTRGGSILARDGFAPLLSNRETNGINNIVPQNGSIYISDLALCGGGGMSDTQYAQFVDGRIGKTRINTSQFPITGGEIRLRLEECTLNSSITPQNDISYYHFANCTVAGSRIPGERIVEKAGVITRSESAWFHAPATAADVTWRYTDRTVAPGATLRWRCAWRREGPAATRASVAVTDAATWWPSLWPLGADALSCVEFEGGTAEWKAELLTWRNTSPEVVQVRVWECVTGSIEGGYLQVEEIKGGPL